MKTSKLIIALLLSLVFIFQSCVQDQLNSEIEVVAELSAPELPSTDMMTIPTEALSEENLGTDPNRGVPFNWLHAAVNLVVWNAVVVVNVAPPVAAFAAAANTQPVYVGDSTFKWTYSFTTQPVHGGKTYVMVLSGKYIDNALAVEWTMEASEIGGFSNFVWYSGITSTQNIEGSFIINKDPYNPQPLFGIAYEQFSEDAAAIRFTNSIPGDAGNGDYIEYSTDETNEFNRSFVLQTTDNLMEINWNDPAGNGQVKDPRHFNDNEWHCWDTQQQDMICQ